MSEHEWLAGRCHCRRVMFRVLPLSRRALACNCSICNMKGFLHVIVPEDHFEISRGRDHLETYTFNTGVARHYFCRHCGIHPFYRPRSHPEGISVNLRCLDPEVIGSFELEDFDGQNWEQNVHRIR